MSIAILQECLTKFPSIIFRRGHSLQCLDANELHVYLQGRRPCSFSSRNAKLARENDALVVIDPLLSDQAVILKLLGLKP